MFVDSIEGAGEIQDYACDLVQDHFRLVSLMALLHFKANAFCRIMGLLGQAVAYLDDKQLLKNNTTWRLFSAIDEIKREAEKLKLQTIMQQIWRILRVSITTDPLPDMQVHTLFNELYNRIVDELESNVFLSVPFDMIEYFEQKSLLFGSEVFDKFPSTSFDIAEAGKCFALGRYTAMVFHLMRTMEGGLRALGASLKDPRLDPKTNPTWEKILKRGNEELEKPLAQRSVEWRSDDQFFSAATVHLRAVKDAWRNPTMHVEKKYLTGGQ